MQLSQVRIESIAAGGEGVGRSDGLVVFVPRTAPGDVVTVTVRSKARFGRGVVRSLDYASPVRTDPPCFHYTFDRCGGCQIQHLQYASQVEQKSIIIGDALRRIGKRQVEDPLVEASPKQWRYRTKLTLAIRAKGLQKIAGLRRYDSPGDVFELRECPITDERVLDAWREIARSLHLLPNDDPEIRGSVRVTDDGAAFVLLGGHAWLRHQEFADAVESLAAIWWEPAQGQRRIMTDRRVQAHPFASFAQVNPSMAGQLQEHVLKLALSGSPRRVVDGYAGTGAMAIVLAERGVSVTAIEMDADASQWTEAHLPRGSRALTGRVEDLLESTLPADSVLLNPPRNGLDEQVTTVLENAAEKPARVVYTSCNPATLARDLARMPGYRIESLNGFDMFPQTAHVETVCALVPGAA